MKTTIRTIHEEQYSDGSKTLGILLNTNAVDNPAFKDTFTYIYKEGSYIFFNTIVDMMAHQFYGHDAKVNRAYMSEADFDELYDSNNIEGTFKEHLIWTI